MSVINYRNASIKDLCEKSQTVDRNSGLILGGFHDREVASLLADDKIRMKFLELLAKFKAVQIYGISIRKSFENLLKSKIHLPSSKIPLQELTLAMVPALPDTFFRFFRSLKFFETLETLNIYSVYMNETGLDDARRTILNLAEVKIRSFIHSHFVTGETLILFKKYGSCFNSGEARALNITGFNIYSSQSLRLKWRPVYENDLSKWNNYLYDHNL